MIDLNGIILREEYQLPIHEKTLEYMRTSNKPSFINASVGSGKTVNIAAITKHLVAAGARVLVLARQGELIEQNVAMSRKCGVKCSIYSASLNSASTFHPAVFGTEGTICRALETDFKDLKFNAVLIDECHHLNWCDLVPASARSMTMQDIGNYTQTEQFKTSEPTQYARILAHLIDLNPKIKIIGYTGSPYRGKEDIKGAFWHQSIYDVSTMYLVGLGYLVPPVFGFGDDAHKYDLSEWTPSDPTSTADYSSKDLQAMQRKITKDKQLTQIIIEEVISICDARKGGVMITCAGQKHCQQVAEFLPRDSWAIITDKTATKSRREILKKCRTGEVKYILQVGCLTTGVNCPPWSTSVILRRIGSLTLLTQLIGRILRINEDEDIERGFDKKDGLVLDYTDTFSSFGDIYDDPMLEKARAFKAIDQGATEECPLCSQLNSKHAVRCIGQANNEDGRCEHYFNFSMCFSCNTQNAPTARNCRKCEAILIDPAKALKNKAYSDADYKEVLTMDIKKMAKGDGFSVTYVLNSIYTQSGIEMQEIAKEYIKPFSKERHEQAKYYAFLKAHVNCFKMTSRVKSWRTIAEFIQNKAFFDRPKLITHRINDKSFSIISRKQFLSGRES